MVWAINTQNLVKATSPATCKDALGNGLSTFRAVMLALAPRTTSGSLLIQWFGWNPYTPAGVRSLSTVIELKVAKEDLGKVIGKQGRTARSMRTILNAASTKLHKRSVLEIVE